MEQAPISKFRAGTGTALQIEELVMPCQYINSFVDIPPPGCLWKNNVWDDQFNICFSFNIFSFHNDPGCFLIFQVQDVKSILNLE